MMSMDVNAVADHFIGQAHKARISVSPLKLQMLMFYAQAWHLVLKSEALVDARFEAWVWGPACPVIRARCGGDGWLPILGAVAVPALPDEVDSFLGEAWEAYGAFSSRDLEVMAQAEQPWQSARRGLPADASSNAEITQESMREYYTALLLSKRAPPDVRG